MWPDKRRKNSHVKIIINNKTSFCLESVAVNTQIQFLKNKTHKYV